jgi:small subunit ribosomal protein S14
LEDLMAKKSSINKNQRRRKLVDQYAERRKALKEVAADQAKPAEERFAARLKLAKLPRNSSKTRIRNRCEITGRARAYYRKLKLCRNQLRELASQGMIPGMVKSSW